MNTTPQLAPTSATTPTSSDTSFLVLGGTGRTGRRVTAQLQARGHSPRVASRVGTPAFDWHDESTWADMLAGAQRAFLAFHPDIAAPGAADLLGRFAATATAHGLDRIVLLSGRGEAGAARAEQAVRDQIAELTVIRSSFFMQDFSEHFLVDDVRRGLIVMPAGSQKLSAVAFSLVVTWICGT